MSQRRRWRATATAACALAAAVAWWTSPSPTVGPSVVVLRAGHAGAKAGPHPAPQSAYSSPFGSSAAWADKPTENRVDSFERWMQVRSSLQGAEPDGDWGTLDRQGRLQPSRSVRHRFDQLLTLQGEAELDDISSYVRGASLVALGEPGGQQTFGLWNKYLSLLARVYQTSVSPTDASGWQAALDERRAARRQMLGADWAEAFFGEEEREFEALIRQNVQAR